MQRMAARSWSPGVAVLVGLLLVAVSAPADAKGKKGRADAAALVPRPGVAATAPVAAPTAVSSRRNLLVSDRTR